jgi:hypothetical protein
MRKWRGSQLEFQMQWLVEHMGFMTLDGTDENDTKLLRVFEETGRAHFELKQIPFTTELIGLNAIDLGQPALLYGSTKS